MYSSDVLSSQIDPFIIGFMTIAVSIVLLIAFLFYIFNAIGIYTIAKRRGYKKAWLAFIPFVNSYALGAIADNINACYMKKSNFRIWLIISNITALVLGIAQFAVSISSAYAMALNTMMYGVEPDFASVSSNFLIWGILQLLSLAIFILNCVCWYKIFADYSPNNATLFIVLSIIFRLSPFFIFAIRNKPSASLYYANQRINQQQYQSNTQYQAPQQPVGQQEPVSNCVEVENSEIKTDENN